MVRVAASTRPPWLLGANAPQIQFVNGMRHGWAPDWGPGLKMLGIILAFSAVFWLSRNRSALATTISGILLLVFLGLVVVHRSDGYGECGTFVHPVSSDPPGVTTCRSERTSTAGLTVLVASALGAVLWRFAQSEAAAREEAVADREQLVATMALVEEKAAEERAAAEAAAEEAARAGAESGPPGPPGGDDEGGDPSGRDITGPAKRTRFGGRSPAAPSDSSG